MLCTPNRRLLTAAAVAVGLALAGCSSDPTSPPPPDGPADIEGYPEVPRPKTVDDYDVPDTSEVMEVVEPIAGKDIDFCPTWVHATFTWDIDIQTTYQTLTPIGWVNDQDPPSDYWSGRRNSRQLLFEGGVVDLRSPYPVEAYVLYGPYEQYRIPMPRRLLLVQSGQTLAVPYNPLLQPDQCYFNFGPDYRTHEVTFSPQVFVGIWDLKVEDGFGQRYKKRIYHVAATSAPPIAAPVYMMRERFWERVPVDGVKSVTVDPGATKSVTYTRTTGMSTTDASSFGETLEASASFAPEGIGPAISSATTETFSTSREVTEEESVSAEYTITGIEGKTIVFSVWRSVERYTFTDENGNPYSDPNYTFGDLGYAEIRGDHEILQSALFDYQP